MPPRGTPPRGTPSFATLSRLGAAALIGVAAGYGARRLAQRLERSAVASPRIDWRQAHSLALRVAAWQEGAYFDREARGAEYARLVARSEPLVADFLRVQLPQPVEQVRAVDRREWLEANFTSLATLLEPLEEVFARLRAQASSPLIAPLVGGKLAGAQIGLLFGVLARRVLGQYDLSLLSPDPASRGTLLFVEPNIALLSAKLELPEEDFRLWIALHEVTHVFQFEAYPWVKPHFSGLLRRMLEEVADGLARPGPGLSLLLVRLVESGLKGRHWVEGALSPRGRLLLDESQALMSLAEGYSNYLMRQIGRELLPSYDAIEAGMKAREASKPPLLELFDRLTGMDLKLAQYKEGEAFVSAVVRARSLAFANRAWEGPENLPTRAEIRAPETWIRRMER